MGIGYIDWPDFLAKKLAQSPFLSPESVYLTWYGSVISLPFRYQYPAVTSGARPSPTAPTDAPIVAHTQGSASAAAPSWLIPAAIGAAALLLLGGHK